MLTSAEQRAMDVTRANAALLDDFLRLCTRPEILDRITRAALDITRGYEDTDFTFEVIRPQLEQIVQECITRRSTRSMVSVGVEYAVVIFTLGSSARRLPPGIVRQDDLPSPELLNALMFINMQRFVGVALGDLMHRLRSLRLAELALLN